MFGKKSPAGPTAEEVAAAKEAVAAERVRAMASLAARAQEKVDTWEQELQARPLYDQTKPCAKCGCEQHRARYTRPTFTVRGNVPEWSDASEERREYEASETARASLGALYVKCSHCGFGWITRPLDADDEIDATTQAIENEENDAVSSALNPQTPYVNLYPPLQSLAGISAAPSNMFRSRGLLGGMFGV